MVVCPAGRSRRERSPRPGSVSVPRIVAHHFAGLTRGRRPKKRVPRFLVAEGLVCLADATVSQFLRGGMTSRPADLLLGGMHMSGRSAPDAAISLSSFRHALWEVFSKGLSGGEMNEEPFTRKDRPSARLVTRTQPATAGRRARSSASDRRSRWVLVLLGVVGVAPGACTENNAEVVDSGSLHDAVLPLLARDGGADVASGDSDSAHADGASPVDADLAATDGTTRGGDAQTTIDVAVDTGLLSVDHGADGDEADAGPAPDVAGVDCRTNAACNERAYCDFGRGCTMRTGRCTARPTACPRDIDWVCGCDGRSYANACSAAAAGATVAHGGRCSDDQRSCDGIAGHYATTVAAARACNPQATNDLQCVVVAADSLYCPCATAANAAFVEELRGLQTRFDQLGCTPQFACGRACLAIGAAYCSEDGLCLGRDLWIP